MVVLGGIIVVEAGSWKRVEIYAPVTIEIHFHNYPTTAGITVGNFRSGSSHDISVRVK